MYVVWTPNPEKFDYVLFFARTKKEIREKFEIYKEENNYDKDEYLERISLERGDTLNIGSSECLFNFSKVNMDYEEDIFILTTDIDEGGGGSKEITINFANSEDDIIDIAVDIFENESKKKEKRHINKLKNALKTEGYYNIPHPNSQNFILLSINKFDHIN